jgi:DNA-binding NarL/FixJ family response regulator
MSAFEAAWGEGRALNFENALALALRQLPAHRAAQDTSASGTQQTSTSDLTGLGLTEREIEVLRLVAEGLTNKDIAERLVLSHRTVQAHLYRIFSKLDVTTRSAATRTAIQRRIV